jgi:hypothetical protein
MSIKSIAAKLFANYIYKQTQGWVTDQAFNQQAVFNQLIQEAKLPLVNHRFDSIKTLLILPPGLGLYEDLKPYVDKVVEGQTFSGKENHCILLKHLVRPQGKTFR